MHTKVECTYCNATHQLLNVPPEYFQCHHYDTVKLNVTFWLGKSYSRKNASQWEYNHRVVKPVLQTLNGGPGHRRLEPIPAVKQWETGCTLDRLSVCCSNGDHNKQSDCKILQSQSVILFYLVQRGVVHSVPCFRFHKLYLAAGHWLETEVLILN